MHGLDAIRVSPGWMTAFTSFVYFRVRYLSQQKKNICIMNETSRQAKSTMVGQSVLLCQQIV